ncbi:MAG TPA: hypothetical protein VJ998_10995, partial [Pseudomonadales bacterium]|nr:hypothetical protein [Pseudomonadales bacterium]
DIGRDHLIVSTGAWTCQRAARWDNWICIQTLHDGYHLYDDTMLFDLAADPHETNNVAEANPAARDKGLALLGEWHGLMMADAARGRDPLVHVIEEGGPFHVKGELPAYLKRLRDTDRSAYADALESKYAAELASAS